MNEIERKIYVDEELFKNEYSYMYGDKKDELVTFAYYNFRKDKETEVNLDMNYSQAIAFARYRANDKRYRNYEFFIFSTQV